MRRSLLVASVTSVALAAAIACGGSTSGSNGSSGPIDINAFASQVCALYGPCCADAGLPTNGQQCQVLFVALGGAQGTYNASAAGACLDALKQSSSAGTFCQAGGANAPQCNQVFGAGTGTVPPGGQCMKSSDCMASSGETATCQTNVMFVDGGSTDTSTCLVEKPGKAGDSPCVASIIELPGGGTETTFNFSRGNGPPPSTGFKANSYCDFASMTCKASVAAGGSCSGGMMCDSMSYCDSASQTCTAALANGAVCATSEQCQSRACNNGKCENSGNLGLQLICGS
jgi:hypothetical protein